MFQIKIVISDRQRTHTEVSSFGFKVEIHVSLQIYFKWLKH